MSRTRHPRRDPVDGSAQATAQVRPGVYQPSPARPHCRSIRPLDRQVILGHVRKQHDASNEPPRQRAPVILYYLYNWHHLLWAENWKREIKENRPKLVGSQLCCGLLYYTSHSQAVHGFHPTFRKFTSVGIVDK